jgi:hypothetical protein
MIAYFENQIATCGTVINHSTPAHQKSFPSFNFHEDYSTPAANRAIQSGVSVGDASSFA